MVYCSFTTFNIIRFTLGMSNDDITTLLDQADTLLDMGEWTKTEKLSCEIREYFENNKQSISETVQIRMLLIISESLWGRGLTKDALPFAEQALAQSANNASPGIKELKAKALGIIGRVYENLAEYTKALEFYEKSLVISEKLGNMRVAGTTINDIGNVYFCLSESIKSLEYQEKALALFEELGDNLGMAFGNIGIGNVYFTISDYGKAIQYYEQGLALSEEIGNRRAAAFCTLNIGTTLIELSEYKKAQQYYEKSLVLFEDLGDMVAFVHSTVSIGDIYTRLKDYPQSLLYLERALKHSEDIGDRRTTAFALRKLGDTLHAMGRKEEAKEYIYRTLILSREILKTNEHVADLLIMIGRLLSEQNKFEEALVKLEEGLELAEKLGEKMVTSKAQKLLADVYAKQGKKAQAFDHLQKHLTLEKEIFSDETKKKIEAFNIRIAIAEKEKEKEIEKMKREQLERELANTTLQLVAHTNRLAEFRDTIRDIAARMPPTEATVRELRLKLKELSAQSIDWIKYDEQFKAAYPEFTKMLITKYPDLTKTEIRICSLLRMNLRSIEIAQLLSLTERSVEGHRTHVRKKMKLKHSEDLALYLTKL